MPDGDGEKIEMLGAEVLAELDRLLLAQARDGKVTAAVALARVIQGRLKQPAGAVVAGPDLSLTLRELVAELEREVAALKARVGAG
jgi:hypothetical protein